MFDIGRTLLAAAARDRSSLALVDGKQTLTYGELAELATRAVTLLDGLGLQAGDRLLVVMQNRIETALAYWATQLADVIFTPVNWRVKPGELDFFLRDSGARAIIHCGAAADAVAASELAGGLPTVAIDEGEAFLDRVSALPPAAGLPRASADRLSVLLYTSGTTGPGKGVPRSHHAERAAGLAHVAQNAYLSGEATLGIMPLYHTMGVRSLLAMALTNGLFVCQHKFDAGQSLELIARHRLTALYLVPTLYHDMLAHPSFAATDITSVRKLGFAGAPMTASLLARLDAAFAPDLFVNHYGSTEIYTFTTNRHAPNPPPSAGRAGINSEIRLVPLDADGVDDDVAIGEPGQIVARLSSDEAFSGYWYRPDADAKAIRDGWYLTGDVGYLDAEGNLFVTGRIDDMIISGGENILPTEIESVISLHPGVLDVVVVGQPDERLGQRVAAYVTAAGTISPQELDAWCRQSDLADFKRPRDYVFVDELPKSPVGKILRRLLVAAE